MTDVTVTRRNGHIVALACDGHTDYGQEGEDIVCAALSSITQTAVLGLMQVAAIAVKYKTDDKKGRLTMTLPDGLSSDDRRNADMILETMFLGIADLNAEYGKFVRLTVKT
jgi:uncharacterized protein YsxB (DUF464 family)